MIQFRPHHFLCTLGFRGKGYSDEFLRNFQELADRLREDPRAGDALPIEVVSGSDSICSPCPNREGSVCVTEEKIRTLDDAHARVLGIKPGQVLTWGEAKARIAEKMTEEEFDRACAPCAWKPLGICRMALLKLRAKPGPKPENNAKAVWIAALAGLSLLAAHAEAAPRRRPASVGRASIADIESLQEGLLKPTKSRALRDLRSAYEDLLKHSFGSARKRALAALNRNDKDSAQFGDYLGWIAATSEIELGNKACASGDTKSCGAQARSAVGRLLHIIEKFPYSPLLSGLHKELALAELVSAQVSCREKKWASCRDKAEGALQRLSNTKDFGILKPEHLELYGNACRQSPGDLCPAWIQRLVAFFPKNSVELKALARSSQTTIEKQRPSYASARATRSYKAPDLDQVAFDAAITFYFDQKYKDAIKAFQRFIDEYPRSAYRYRAQYWLAQSLGQEQKHDEARAIYDRIRQESPLTYYGLLSSIALGADITATLSSAAPQAATSDPYLVPKEILRIRRAEALLSAGALPLAAMELAGFNARESLSSPFLMYLALLNHLAHNHNTSFTLIGELIQRGYEGIYSASVLKMIFPTPFMNTIEAQSRDARLDPILVLSLMKQESAFNTTANSGVGAQGLMQLMHSTALDVFPDLARWELAQAEVNVKAGTRYLARLLNRFSGNIALATSGYNAGPGAVDRWIKASPKKRGLLEFIEAIPFRETREYAASIIRNYYWYSHLLKGATPKTLGFFWGQGGQPEIKPVVGPDDEATEESDSPSATPSPSVEPSPSATPMGPQPLATPAPSPTSSSPSDSTEEDDGAED